MVIGEASSEQLDIILAQIRVLVHVRKKYACRACEDGVTTAPLPAQPIPKSNASPGLLAHVAVAAAYSETPAHSQDIHEMIIENTDMEVITEQGGKRRQAGTIKPTGTLRLKSQKSLFFMFPTNKNM